MSFFLSVRFLPYIMCLAIPGKIISIDGYKAVAEYDGIKKNIIIALLPAVEVGQYVMVHAGYAIEILDEERAKESLEAWHEALATDLIHEEDIV